MLGAILLDDRHLLSVQLDAQLEAEDFYREQHGHVYAAMLTLHEAGRPIDTLTVVSAMREAGQCDESTEHMVGDLPGWVPAAGHAREYGKIVRDLSLRRRLLLETYETQASVLQGERTARELIEDAERRMLHVADSAVSDLTRLSTVEEMARLESVREGMEVVGVPSGFIDLDRLTSGMHKGNLLILAARPSMGKSALAVNVIEHVVSAGTPAALFSLEMSRAEIVRRLIASRARVSGEALLRGPIPPNQWERVEQAVDELGTWPVYVDDAVDAGVLDIRAKARRLHARAALGLVVVDYVQLMRADAGAENRNIEVGKITRGLKVLAKELDVPVIAVSQLSRAVEQRSDKRPVLSDLRDSGSVEQDADLVMFLYRESYYNEDAEERDVTELNVAKHRNGPLGRVKLTFLPSYPKFANYARADEPMLSPVSDDGERMAF